MKRYQLSFGLILVSSLGVAEPGLLNPGGAGLGRTLTPQEAAAQQQNQAAQANLAGKEAIRKAEEQVRALEADKARNFRAIQAIEKENKDKEKARLAALQNLEPTLAKRNTEIFQIENKDNQNQKEESRATRALQTSIYDNIIKDGQGRFLASTNPAAVVALKERLQTEVGSIADTLSAKATEVADGKPPADPKAAKSIAEEFTLAVVGKPAEGGPLPLKLQKLGEVSKAFEKFIVTKPGSKLANNSEKKEEQQEQPASINHAAGQTISDRSEVGDYAAGESN